MNSDDARVFLAVHRFRTLREAAAGLDADQPTTERRLPAADKTQAGKRVVKTSTEPVGTPLVEPTPPTPQPGGHAPGAFVRGAQRADERLEGEVRVTSPDSLAVDFVVPALRRLRAQHPAIRVVLGTSTDVTDPGRLDADLAIRTERPDNPDLVSRKLAQWDVGLFASRDYLAARGEPQRGQAFAGHDLVMYRPDVARDRDATLCGEPITGGRVVAEVSSSLMLATSVRAGIAIGELPVYIANGDDTLVRIWPERVRAQPCEVWLVLHRDPNPAAHVRATIDAIDMSFAAFRGVSVA